MIIKNNYDLLRTKDDNLKEDKKLLTRKTCISSILSPPKMHFPAKKFYLFYACRSIWFMKGWYNFTYVCLCWKKNCLYWQTWHDTTILDTLYLIQTPSVIKANCRVQIQMQHHAHKSFKYCTWNQLSWYTIHAYTVSYCNTSRHPNTYTGTACTCRW